MPARPPLHSPTIDYRRRPDLYRIARGEQGVLTVEPYKSEILPHWRFRTPEVARQSAAAIMRLFRDYKRRRDFVGMDMARKFLQMGYTRARRYARHRSGRKYAATGDEQPLARDPLKQASADVFFAAWQKVRSDHIYQQAKRKHQASGNSEVTASVERKPEKGAATMAKKKSAKLKSGDRVEWNTSQGKTQGKVVKKVTKTTKIKGHTAKASQAEPQYEVKSEKSGDKAVHKAKSLKKVKKEAQGTSKPSTAKKKSKSPKKSAKRKSAKRKSGRAKASSDDDRRQVIADFREAVNMTPARITKWLKTDESKEVGWTDAGDDESVGHQSGRKIVKLLGKKQSEYTKGDLAHMRKVAGYVQRHLAQRPKSDVEDSRWRYSLMNWGHDPSR